MTVIDSHCHLANRKFQDDLTEVIARAHAAGVASMITIGDSLQESEECLSITKKFDHIFCTVGVHPHESRTWTTESRDALHALAKVSPNVRAIGEIGLDYHDDFSPRDTQRQVFHEQLQLAKDLRLPVVVHCREAVEDVWQIVGNIQPERLVLHCCTERWDGVARFLERGYLLSFTGIATYPNAGEIRDTIRQCPLEQLMIETDAPYLPPVPHRGKRNEPAFVIEVAKLVAQVKGVSVADVDSATTRNTIEFFRLPQ